MAKYLNFIFISLTLTACDTPPNDNSLEEVGENKPDRFSVIQFALNSTIDKCERIASIDFRDEKSKACDIARKEVTDYIWELDPLISIEEFILNEATTDFTISAPQIQGYTNHFSSYRSMLDIVGDGCILLEEKNYNINNIKTCINVGEAAKRQVMNSLNIISVEKKILERTSIIKEMGFTTYDAMHIACAESAQVNIFLSTDDKLVKRALRNKEQLLVVVKNPLTWLQEELLK